MDAKKSKVLIKEWASKILWSFIDILSTCVPNKNENKEVLGYFVELRGIATYVQAPFVGHKAEQEVLEPKEGAMAETKE
jgi:hypothetical protein